LGAEHGFATGNGADRGNEFGLVGALEHVAARAGAQDGGYRCVVVIHGQREHRDGRVAGGDAAGCGDSVQSGHLQVHQHDVGRERADLSQRLAGGVGDAGVVMEGEELPQTLGEQG